MNGNVAAAFSALVIAASGARADGGSAYEALRTARAAAGGAPLTELSGERGEPRPQEWKLIFSDPAARGGVREVVVARDVMVSQRTPLRGYAGIGAEPPLSLSRLNLDSDAAFEIAHKQAKVRQVGFDWVDFTLRANAVSGAPEWLLRLHDHMGVQVGVIRISAEDGSVILPLDVSPPVQTEPPPARLEDSAAGRKIGGVIGTVGGVVERTANTVKNATLRAVGNVQEVLTGDRTIGPKEED